jgi:hypothetical protein
VGRLAGFRYRDVARKLKACGTNRYTTVPNHPGDMLEGTLRAILKQAAVDPDTFLDAGPGLGIDVAESPSRNTIVQRIARTRTSAVRELCRETAADPSGTRFRDRRFTRRNP